MYITYDRIIQLEKIYEEVKRRKGKSKYYKDYPRLLIYFDPKDSSYGFFWELEIGINFASCTNMRNVVKVLLHEYTHYLQDPKATSDSYWDDPCEKEANKPLIGEYI